jgi:D-arabinose 1-dehydrogenase-like Zn-dependent alcohol dehydrogenase
MLDDLGISMSTFGVRSPGHEGAGIVVKIGENVKNWKLGDRAGIKPMMDTCGTCAHCWSDRETYCGSAVHTGLMVPGNLSLAFVGGILLTRIRNLPAIHCLSRAVCIPHPGWNSG